MTLGLAALLGTIGICLWFTCLGFVACILDFIERGIQIFRIWQHKERV